MEIPNAFIGKTAQPTSEELAVALGSAAAAWKEFLDWLADEMGVVDQEWISSHPKSGWALRRKLKKRNIVYLSPCKGCLRVAFVLGNKALAAARQSKLPKSVMKILDQAPHYAEGTGVRLMVHESQDLAPLRILAALKLAN
jgi:hypothetical protein